MAGMIRFQGSAAASGFDVSARYRPLERSMFKDASGKLYIVVNLTRAGKY